MNVNLSTVSTNNKTSLSESGTKGPAEGSESKGFFETLASVFTDSQEKRTEAVKLTAVDSEKSDISSLQTIQPEVESQETVTVDGQTSNSSADVMLAHQKMQPESEEIEPQVTSPVRTANVNNTTAIRNPADNERKAASDFKQSVALDQNIDQKVTTDETSFSHDVTRSMDEGQQLLGRIERANQTLPLVTQDTESGKSLPPELVNISLPPEWQEMSSHETPLVTSLSTDIANLELGEPLTIPSRGDVLDKTTADVIQRISINELDVIDTKLAQGEPLNSQEAEIIEGLKMGSVVIDDVHEEELAQFGAAPTGSKIGLSEPQMTPSSVTRLAATSSTAWQGTSQELKHGTVQVPTPVMDKTVLPVTPEGLAAQMNPVVQQITTNAETRQQAMNLELVTKTLKNTLDNQDKPELPHSLAGQLQAAVNQQSVATPQQVRADAVQQAQLPLQLTKELANEQVAEKVQMMMSKNLKNLDIRLDPPELGRMQIRMTMNSDLANVHFTVTNPQARDIIEQTLPRLREMLAQQGMQLADSSVQQQSTSQQQSGYSASDQNTQNADGRHFFGESDEGLDTDIELNMNVTSVPDGISFYA